MLQRIDLVLADAVQGTQITAPSTWTSMTVDSS